MISILSWKVEVKGRFVLRHKSARFFLVECSHYTTVIIFINLKMDQTEKQLALETISTMADDCTPGESAERIEFYGCCAERSRSTQSRRGYPYDEVNRQLASWLTR